MSYADGSSLECNGQRLQGREMWVHLASRVFLCTCAVALWLTGVTKLVSVIASGELIQAKDPVFDISYRFLLPLVGILEVIVAAHCLFGRNRRIKFLAICWLSLGFAIYRSGHAMLAPRSGCACLGTLPEFMPVLARSIEPVLPAVLAFMLAGSIVLLCLTPNRPLGTEPRDLSPLPGRSS